MSRFKFDQMLKKMDALKRDLPPVIGNMGLRFFVGNFQKEGWTGETFTHWQPRKDKKNTRKLLVGKSGGTKAASHIHLRSAVNNSLVRAVWNEILFDVKGVPYARIHNEGGTIHKYAQSGKLNFKITKSGKSRFAKLKNANFQQNVTFGEHDIKMPKRKYIGNSATLIRQIHNRINEGMLKVLKPI